jgi:hypothetical protein
MLLRTHPLNHWANSPPWWRLVQQSEVMEFLGEYLFQFFVVEKKRPMAAFRSSE